ncbi:TPA: hypothetical protein ACISY6_003297 [Salmonella enterica subsp. enterica serovar Eastbourne]
MGEFSNLLNSIPGWLSSSLTALVGTLIGGWFTLKGVTQQAKLSKVETERESLELQLSVLKGVKGEVFTLINLYNKRMKTHVDNIKPGQILILTFPVGDDNFTFYEQNANVIAKLNDSARDSIINIYTYSRSLIQSFKGCDCVIFKITKDRPRAYDFSVSYKSFILVLCELYRILYVLFCPKTAPKAPFLPQ